MARLDYEDFGTGRYLAKNQSLAPLGSCADSLNFLHSQDRNHAVLRGPVDRTWATRPENARVLLAWEYINASGTKLLLAKVGAKLYTFTLGITGALTEILASMDSTHIPSVTNANGKVFIADWQAKNYSSDGTSNGSNELQKAAGAQGGITLAAAGTATGNAAGTIYYSYTNVNAYDGAESPPSTAQSVSRTADQGVTVTNAALSFTTPWTTVNLYRTAAGSNQMYLVTTGLTSGSFPYADTSLDSSLTTTSTVHAEDSRTASIEKPSAAKHCAFFRGRLFLANFSGARTRVRWSRVGEPTQFETSTSARFDVGRDDGGEITGLAVFRGSLLIFKTGSVWVLNGDVDETGFVFAPVLIGKGCVASRTIVVNGDRQVLFLSDCGVVSYDLATATIVSDNIASDLHALNYTDRADFFCAGMDICERVYLLSVSPAAATTNTKTHALNLDTGAWSRFEFNMGQVTPSCYSSADIGAIHNSAAGRVGLYFGSENGYLYEWDGASSADGVASGTHEATITARTATTTTTATGWRITGDGLTGLGMTLRRAADGTHETVAITSNTATVITHAAFSGTAAAVGDTVYVGAYQGTLAFNRTNVKTGHKKRWERLEVELEKQANDVPLRLGWTIDDGSAPTSSTEFDPSTRWVCRLPIHRRAVGFAPYLDIIGTALTIEIIGVHVDYEILGARLPT